MRAKDGLPRSVRLTAGLGLSAEEQALEILIQSLGGLFFGASNVKKSDEVRTL